MPAREGAEMAKGRVGGSCGGKGEERWNGGCGKGVGQTLGDTVSYMVGTV